MPTIAGIKVSKELAAKLDAIVEEYTNKGVQDSLDYINSPQFEEDIVQWRKDNPKLVEMDKKLLARQSKR